MRYWRVFNDRGACLATAAPSEDVRRGVVRLATGAWLDPEVRGEPGTMCKHGNPNVLTPDKGTSRLAQGPIAHTCLVEVERFEGAPPAVTAFEPPKVIRPSQPGIEGAVTKRLPGQRLPMQTTVRAASAGTPPAVIPAKAGIHCRHRIRETLRVSRHVDTSMPSR